MIGTPGEDQSASTRADTRNPSWKEGRDAAGADARGGPGSPPYDRAFGTPHGVSAGAAREPAGLRRSGRTQELHPRRRRTRRHLGPRLHARKLFDEWLVPVCTPQLLQRHGLVTEARDLRHYKLLHSTYEPWTAWLLEGGPDEVWPSSGAAFDDAIAIVRAGEAGQGL